MTHKFKIGDRVKFITGDEVFKVSCIMIEVGSIAYAFEGSTNELHHEHLLEKAPEYDYLYVFFYEPNQDWLVSSGRYQSDDDFSRTNKIEDKFQKIEASKREKV